MWFGISVADTPLLQVVVFLPTELIPYEVTARLASTSIRR